ncbi:Tetrathionate reductase subunit B [invertebrate metagenome]|uniref:Tetrathionate reductase subunit B n=1 Tax=invertebrate metagenome TaxID=1711999 RepID=A0A2H9T6M1_9ZZZZ
MDVNKRRFLSKIAAVTAGASLIPLANADSSLSQLNKKQPERREGIPGKRFAMVVDLRRCIGCQACTVACSVENQMPVGQFRTTVKQYEVSVKEPDTHRTTSKNFMLPRLCNHCDDPPCVPVCPVQATYQRTDGIVVVDNTRCVGCGYCVQACPYDARFINEETKTADKCTFCAHRLANGLLPACVESCVGGARNIGDINDKNSEVSQLLRENSDDIHVLKPEEGTLPHVFYIGMNRAFVSRVKGQPAILHDLT